MTVIIDYGLGNIGSIRNMLHRIGIESITSSAYAEISQASRIIIPGVGAFDHGMKNLADRQMIEILRRRILTDRVPALGICLGMQLLTHSSEEGCLAGLGCLDAVTVRLDSGETDGSLRLPHMGWNEVKPVRDTALLRPLDGESRFYFVHSYRVVCRHSGDILSLTHYGCDFVSAFQKDNLVGVQFHPEKSHRFGMEFIRNFAEI